MRHNIEISNSDDTIDSRDVIARIEELESEREALADEFEEAVDAHLANTDPDLRHGLNDARNNAYKAVYEWDNDNKAELDALKALAEEAEGYASDWNHGEQLIRESYFTEYAQELCEDIQTFRVTFPTTLRLIGKLQHATSSKTIQKFHLME